MSPDPNLQDPDGGFNGAGLESSGYGPATALTFNPITRQLEAARHIRAVDEFSELDQISELQFYEQKENRRQGDYSGTPVVSEERLAYEQSVIRNKNSDIRLDYWRSESDGTITLETWTRGADRLIDGVHVSSVSFYRSRIDPSTNETIGARIREANIPLSIVRETTRGGHVRERPETVSEFIESQRNAALHAGYHLGRFNSSALQERYERPQPVVLDLDGNGIPVTELAQSQHYVDGGDGLLHRTAWAAPGDGVLFFDVSGDGRIKEKREYVFTEWDPTSASDLDALRAA